MIENACCRILNGLTKIKDLHNEFLKEKNKKEL